MSQIRFFTEEQEATIPQLQEKWQNIAFSTERINPDLAEAAVKEIYAVMGEQEPEIIFCDGPNAALERLEPYISSVETPQQNTARSPEEMLQGLNFVKFFARAAWESFRQNNKRKQAKTIVIVNLLKELSQQPHKSLAKHIDKILPQDLTTQEIVEQSFLSATPLFNSLGKYEARQGEPDFLKVMETKPDTEWQESFSQTASALEQQLSWLPGKKFLFRQWLKRFLQGSISSKITGTDYPKLQEIYYSQLTFLQRKFLSENAPIITTDLAINCILFEFCFSVLNFPCKLQKWEALQNLVRHCGWIFAVGNTCLICDRPTKILLDEDNQLHAAGESALEYADGYVAYAYHGFSLPERYGTVHPFQWQSEWVLSEPNRQLKKVLIQGIGVARICQELSLIEVEKSGEYTLFKLDENTGTDAIYFLQRINPETKEIKAVSVSWTSNTLASAIEYARNNYSAEDFPLPN